MRKLVLAAALCTLSSLTALAAENPWAGTWKLNPAKSHFTGETFTYSRSANGMMHYSDGSSDAYDFAPDGHDYPTPFGGTVTVTGESPDAWKIVHKRDGKVLDTDNFSLSPDSKTLTVKSTGTKPDGTDFNDEATFVRVSGAKGPEGKWKSTKVTISAPGTWVISFPAADTIRWDIPDYKESVEGKTDGSDMAISGPTAPKNMTLAVKLVGKKISYTVKHDGKPIGHGDITLAANSKVATDVSWNEGKQTEKTSAVFEKQ